VSESAMLQVLGAIAYGELKAYEGAKAKAAEAEDPEERRAWRKVAAEELRHHKGFARRIEALGGDPERAMAPYRASLDHFHGLPEERDPVAAAVCDFLGEGIAADLLRWFKTVADPETAAFVETVLADEVEHEGRAVAAVRQCIAGAPDGRRRAAAGARRMLLRMVTSSPGSGPSFLAFVRIGRPQALLGALAAGYVRRLRAVGVGPLAEVERLLRGGQAAA
jgi:ferritin-like protein